MGLSNAYSMLDTTPRGRLWARFVLAGVQSSGGFPVLSDPRAPRPPVTRRFVDRIRAVASATPSATAIVHDELGLVSYGQLVDQVEETGNRLSAAGVRPGHTVMIHARRVPQLPVALLSLWDLGATVCIVDAATPTHRLDTCARMVGPHWRLLLDQDDPIPVKRGSGGAAAAPAVEPHSHILFTSGTTGRPAAVAIGHHPLWRALEWYFQTFAPGPGDRTGLLAGLGHDPVLRDILVPLLSGGTLVVPPADMLDRPHGILPFLQQHRITVLHCTPALLDIILTVSALASPPRLDDLRLVVTAGAPLFKAAVRRLRELTGAVVVNAYGSTETPQIASYEAIGPTAQLPDNVALPVGTGAGDTQLLIADAAGRFDTVTSGEVVVRGRNLAAGYLGDSGPNERFIADPFGVAGFRAYRTGDIGERDDTGRVRIVGRLDRELSVNGFRVAPEEIEHAVLAHPAVARAVAGVVTGPAGESVGLTVVLASGHRIDAAAIRTFLRSRLPRYALPGRIRIVDRLPLNRNHKVARPSPTGPARQRARFETAVATDLDGTLLRTDRTVSTRTLSALAALVEWGAVHVLVTGRPARECVDLMAAIGYHGLAVCGQGAQLYDADARQLVASATVDIDTAREAVARLGAEFGGLRVAVGTAGRDGRLLCAPGFAPPEGRTVVPDEHSLWAAPVEKVLLRHDNVSADVLATAAERVCDAGLTVMHSDIGLVELLPTGVTKATGLARVAEHLGLPPDRVVAFGDMPNDIPMLTWAGHGVAMGNAHPAVCAVADEVCPTNDEDGVAHVLDRLFLTGSAGTRPGDRVERVSGAHPK
jgi:HAD superfamily hydrolase (TIGR01484 family)